MTKTTYFIVTNDNQTNFENEITECLNSKEIKYELIGSLVIEGNTFFQALLRTEKLTDNPYSKM